MSRLLAWFMTSGKCFLTTLKVSFSSFKSSAWCSFSKLWSVDTLRRVLGFSVRSHQDRSVALFILPSSALSSKYGQLWRQETIIRAALSAINYTFYLQNVLHTQNLPDNIRVAINWLIDQSVKCQEILKGAQHTLTGNVFKSLVLSDNFMFDWFTKLL